MILNRLEYLLMNNPGRAAVQRFFEAPRMRRMGGAVPGGRALEIGCGQGAAARFILTEFDVTRVDAFDLDPRMVARARKRIDRGRVRAGVWLGDATFLPVPDATYDAVFDFGILHHVPDWRRAIEEIVRVLRPGGRLFAEEPQADFLAGPIMSRLFDHPVEDRFDHGRFCSFLRSSGLEISAEHQMGRSFSWVVATRPDIPDLKP